jgi:hypothetical protein
VHIGYSPTSIEPCHEVLLEAEEKLPGGEDGEVEEFLGV